MEPQNNSIELIWKDYHAKLYNFIRTRVSDETVTDDILQDVFLKIQNQIDSLKDSNKIQSWIYRITRNTIIDYYRSRKSTDTLPETLADRDDDFTDDTRSEMSGWLLPMINRLPESYREALILSEIEGLPQKEIALRQGISISGAKSRIQRGRSMVKQLLVDCCQFEFDRRGRVIGYKHNGAEGKCDECR